MTGPVKEQPMDPFEHMEAERARLAREGMYRPEYESDACGVGLVAATDGKPSRRVVASTLCRRMLATSTRSSTLC